MARIGPAPSQPPQQPQDLSRTTASAKKLKREVQALIEQINNMTPRSADDPRFLTGFASHISAVAAACKDAKHA